MAVSGDRDELHEMVINNQIPWSPQKNKERSQRRNSGPLYDLSNTPIVPERTPGKDSAPAFPPLSTKSTDFEEKTLQQNQLYILGEALSQSKRALDENKKEISLKQQQLQPLYTALSAQTENLSTRVKIFKIKEGFFNKCKILLASSTPEGHEILRDMNEHIQAEMHELSLIEKSLTSAQAHLQSESNQQNQKEVAIKLTETKLTQLLAQWTDLYKQIYNL